MKARSRLEAKGNAAPGPAPGAQRREALAIFAEIQKQLENDPDFLSARLITPEGGIIWRNRGFCKDFCVSGFLVLFFCWVNFPSPCNEIERAGGEPEP